MVNLALYAKEYSVSGRPTLLRRIQTPTGHAAARAPSDSGVRDPPEASDFTISHKALAFASGVLASGVLSPFTRSIRHTAYTPMYRAARIAFSSIPSHIIT